MGRAALGHFGRHPVGEVEAAQVVPQPDAPAQQDRRDRDVQVVDQTGAQEAPRGPDPAADANVQAARGLGRLGQHVLDGATAEVERRTALHRDRRPRRGAGEDVDRGAERRPVAPPALPVGVIGERVQAEHGRAHDLGADALEVGGGVGVVDAGRAGTAGVAEDALLERAGRGVGRREATPVLAHRVLGGGVGPRGEAVEGDVEVDANAGHVRCPSR